MTPAKILAPTTIKLPVVDARPRPMRMRGQVGTFRLEAELTLEHSRIHHRRRPNPTIIKTSPTTSDILGSSSMPGCGTRIHNKPKAVTSHGRP